MEELLILGKTQKAKFKGRCSVCDSNYNAGSWVSFTTSRNWVHEECGLTLRPAQIGLFK